MSYSNPYSPDSYLTDGTTDTFAITFQFLATTDVILYFTPAGQIFDPIVDLVSGGYNIHPNTPPTIGGNIVFTTAPVAGGTLLITRQMALTDPTAFYIPQKFNGAALDKAILRLVMLIQQLAYYGHTEYLRYPFNSQEPTQVAVLREGEIWQKVNGQVVGRTILPPATSLLASYFAKFGLNYIIANSPPNQLNISPGCKGTTTGQLIILNSPTYKIANLPFSVGAGGGAALFTTTGFRGWAFLFLIQNITTQSVEIVIDNNLSCSHRPFEYALFTRIGCIFFDAGNAISQAMTTDGWWSTTDNFKTGTISSSTTSTFFMLTNTSLAPGGSDFDIGLPFFNNVRLNLNVSVQFNNVGITDLFKVTTIATPYINEGLGSPLNTYLTSGALPTSQTLVFENSMDLPFEDINTLPHIKLYTQIEDAIVTGTTLSWELTSFKDLFIQ